MKDDISGFMVMCWLAEDHALKSLPEAEYDEWVEYYKVVIPPFHKAGMFHYFVQTCWY